MSKVVFLTSLFLSLFTSAHALDKQEGVFGSDGYPLDCQSDAYKTIDERTLCAVAKKENISVSTFGVSALLLQMSITSYLCGFELKDDFYTGLLKIKVLNPKSFEIALKYASYDEPTDCSVEKRMLKDQLK